MDTDTGELQTAHDELIHRLSLHIDNPDLPDSQRELAQAWRQQVEYARERAVARLTIAFIAQVGRGKSTLVAAATGLRLPVDSMNPKKWSVLPVGDGRTTLGETRIYFEARDDFELRVDPIPRDELLTELRLFARDLSHRSAGKSSAASPSPAGEEMYGLLRQWLATTPEDPRAELQALARSTDPEILEQLLVSRLDLDKRTAPTMRHFPADPAGLAALKQELRDLMLGRMADAPAPSVVHIRIPPNILATEIDRIIDTRGVDADAPELLLRGRRDLHELLADPDTLPILCSEFASAPDHVTRELLKLDTEIARPRGKDRPSPRILIVDDREPDEDPTEQREQTRLRDERVAQCRDRLHAVAPSLPPNCVVALDARHETDALRDVLAGMTREARLARLTAWQQALQEANDACATFADAEFAAEAHAIDLQLWWAWDSAFAKSIEQSVPGLTAVGAALITRKLKSIQHWSHVHAAMRRRGKYRQLDLAALGSRILSVLQILPFLEALETKRNELSAVLTGRLAVHLNLRHKQFQQAHVSRLIDLAEAWRKVLADYFASPSSDALWAWCEARWGRGEGYLTDLADRFGQESEAVNLQLTPPLPPLEESLPPRPPLFSLRRVGLRNFRCVVDRTADISERITVFAGDNGLGKTCWLEAIAAAAGAILPAMDAGPAPPLVNTDVRQQIRELRGVPDRQYQLPLEIHVEATIQGHPLRWIRGIKTTIEGTPVADDDALRVVGATIARAVREHSQQQLPVLAYYGTKRLWPALDAHTDRREVGSRFDGYRDSLQAASTHRHMLDWVRHYTLVELQRKTPQVQLRAIEHAVIACVEGAVHFGYDLALEDLTLTMADGQVFTFRMLSDGYRNIVAMVADIAWRASVLNPQLGDRAAALAEGIVLVDEIDLHLHPKWQRRVLADLHRAFPRLQFVATTHSPFIIQSLRPGQLVNLDPDAADAPYADKSPEDITEQIMGVELPQRSERRQREYEAARRYYELLDQMPDADDPTLARLKAELDEIVAPYADNQAFVAFLERKRLIVEAKGA